MGGTLCGRRVALVHEDAFFGAYLADVIAANGATIVGVVALASEGTALLDHDPPPCVLVLSTGVRDHDAVARVAVARQVAMLVVQPARPRGGSSPHLAACPPGLTMPFAGFQVVDALLRLLASRGTDAVALRGSPLWNR